MNWADVLFVDPLQHWREKHHRPHEGPAPWSPRSEAAFQHVPATTIQAQPHG